MSSFAKSSVIVFHADRRSATGGNMGGFAVVAEVFPGAQGFVQRRQKILKAETRKQGVGADGLALVHHDGRCRICNPGVRVRW